MIFVSLHKKLIRTILKYHNAVSCSNQYNHRMFFTAWSLIKPRSRAVLLYGFIIYNDNMGGNDASRIINVIPFAFVDEQACFLQILFVTHHLETLCRKENKKQTSRKIHVISKHSNPLLFWKVKTLIISTLKNK